MASYVRRASTLLCEVWVLAFSKKLFHSLQEANNHHMSLSRSLFCLSSVRRMHTVGPQKGLCSSMYFPSLSISNEQRHWAKPRALRGAWLLASVAWGKLLNNKYFYIPLYLLFRYHLSLSKISFITFHDTEQEVRQGFSITNERLRIRN